MGSRIVVALRALARLGGADDWVTLHRLAEVVRADLSELSSRAAERAVVDIAPDEVEDLLQGEVAPRLAAAAFLEHREHEVRPAPSLASPELLAVVEERLGALLAPPPPEVVAAAVAPPPSDGSTLSAQGLVKVYRKRRVVNDVAVRVSQGEIVGLLGPNGAGKTTTFYMMVGLIAPDAGRVRLGQQDVTDVPMYQRAGDLEPAALAAGQRVCLRAPQVLDAQLVQQRL
ncbi:MAG: ATP-binding cassette domain-containing protein, partial [Actinomycetota bacterium]